MKLHSFVFAFLIAVTFGLVSNDALAQDATVLDSTHYKVEFENDDVRVIRITYGPGEESVMHEHPASVVIFLTDGMGQMTFPDGTTDDFDFSAGMTGPNPAITHQPKNTGDAPFELIQVELKSPTDMPDEY